MNYFNFEKWRSRFGSYNNGIATIVLVFFFTLLLLPLSYLSLKTDNAWATSPGPTIPVYMISTRDGSDSPQEEVGTGYDGRPLGNISKLKIECPSEIAIFVHGWGNDDNKAKERLNRLRLSLIENNYTIPLVGLSWPSNTT
jgi:hypothetical protein